jgi:hypothetical protein
MEMMRTDWCKGEFFRGKRAQAQTLKLREASVSGTAVQQSIAETWRLPEKWTLSDPECEK